MGGWVQPDRWRNGPLNRSWRLLWERVDPNTLDKTMQGSKNHFLARVGPALGLVLVIAAFSLLSDSPGQYLNDRNLRIILSQTVVVALGALGMTIIIISGGIDLSVGSVIALSGVIAALGIREGLPPEFAVLSWDRQRSARRIRQLPGHHPPQGSALRCHTDLPPRTSPPSKLDSEPFEVHSKG